MASTKRQVALAAAALGLAFGPFAISAEAPAAPEPNVAATIERTAESNEACLVVAEIREPQSNDVLFEPRLRVSAGQEAKASISDADRKVEITVKAGPGCAGGRYLVNVWTAGKAASSTSGTLKPKAP